ncbi:phospholipid/cholesterol/gamma-HCH transport system substrate-binding protein [Gelidibacter algens]|uniref:Phospholipid/cholesterol/gamma-HCH transport system substrate-binding protein n=1 Tax=Gelidibacter algens TaxID=49280 RepID=A0A1A7R724_9FLAO|nr:MlaD family protein [Gelidibacter algens]OBX26547.1 mammalian cell entry protein [Gelidibacter algens]RAJ26624.1 phospholipid/cholesterol/gamma-HCH transport system substrate-binding protein [Gelidibacter algens]
MKISREVKTAILVISGILLMVFTINYLKGINILNEHNRYQTQFDYNALSTSSIVTIKGNKIGKVEEISYDDLTGKTIVTIVVTENVKFSTNSKIRMYETGLMGGNALAIIPMPGPELAEDGEFLESEIEEGLITSLTKNFSGISSNLGVTLKTADSLMSNFNTLIINENEDGLRSAIAELNKTIISFRSVSNAMSTLVVKNDAALTSAIGNFDTLSGNLAEITTEFKQVEISKTFASLDNTLQEVNDLLASVKDGKGTLGKMLNDDQLYTNLEMASLQLEQLLQDVKLNPKRYVHFSVFGKKAKQFDAEGNIIEDVKSQPEEIQVELENN